MQRFRLLRFYTVVVVAVAALAVWGVSKSRTAAEVATPQQLEAGTAEPSRHTQMESVANLQLTTPGTYEYFCAVHPKMTGKIIVK
jgi:plastocyanin